MPRLMLADAAALSSLVNEYSCGQPGPGAHEATGPSRLSFAQSLTITSPTLAIAFSVAWACCSSWAPSSFAAIEKSLYVGAPELLAPNQLGADRKSTRL